MRLRPGTSPTAAIVAGFACTVMGRLAGQGTVGWFVRPKYAHQWSSCLSCVAERGSVAGWWSPRVVVVNRITGVWRYFPAIWWLPEYTGFSFYPSGTFFTSSFFVLGRHGLKAEYKSVAII